MTAINSLAKWLIVLSIPAALIVGLLMQLSAAAAQLGQLIAGVH